MRVVGGLRKNAAGSFCRHFESFKPTPSTIPPSRTPDALLDRYHTLTEWSMAVAGAGATVSVVQRFHTAGRVERDGMPYEFVKDHQDAVAVDQGRAGSRSWRRLRKQRRTSFTSTG